MQNSGLNWISAASINKAVNNGDFLLVSDGSSIMPAWFDWTTGNYYQRTASLRNDEVANAATYTTTPIPFVVVYFVEILPLVNHTIHVKAVNSIY